MGGGVTWKGERRGYVAATEARVVSPVPVAPVISQA
jgi:hypothetical protein